jgi:predicted DNA-binding transcriptional regulator AlpA
LALRNDISQATFSAADIQKYLGISRTGAYNLMRSRGFPSFRIGKRVFVTQEALSAWFLGLQGGSCADRK